MRTSRPGSSERPEVAAFPASEARSLSLSTSSREASRPLASSLGEMGGFSGSDECPFRCAVGRFGEPAMAGTGGTCSSSESESLAGAPLALRHGFSPGFFFSLPIGYGNASSEPSFVRLSQVSAVCAASAKMMSFLVCRADGRSFGKLARTNQVWNAPLSPRPSTIATHTNERYKFASSKVYERQGTTNSECLSSVH